jgi:spore germination protein
VGISVNEVDQEPLTTKQIIWVVAALAPIGIISLPQEINRYAQQSGWITLLAAFVAVIIFSRFIFALAKRHPGESIHNILKKILGKWLGYGVTLLLLAQIIAGCGVSTRLLAEGANTYLLFHTPSAVIVAAMLLSVIYIVNKGLFAVARLNTLIQPVMLSILLIMFLLTIPFTDFSHFLPLVSDKLDLGKSIFPSLFPYVTLFSTVFLLHQAPEPKKLLRGIRWGVLFIFAPSFLLFVFTEAIFGTIEINYIEYPSIDMARIISYPMVERMEILYMIYWIMFEFTLLTITCTLSVYGLKRLVNKGSIRLWSIIVLCIVFALSRWPANIDMARHLSSTLNQTSMGILIGVYPLIVLIDAVKKKVSR